MKRSIVLALCMIMATVSNAQSKTLTAKIPAFPPPSRKGFDLGTSRRPDGTTLTVDSESLRLNHKRWFPVMGEFHFSRYPAAEWRRELLKMKAGGIDIVATYVFWIHHEEIEGQFDWRGQRNLRRFIQTADEIGLKALVRCGPWCHGEVRNGGQPDWLLHQGWKLRSNDPNYLARVTRLYQQIAGQLQGLLWKDGGPVIGIQLENEYGGSFKHLLKLKQIARAAGLDVPLYTRTGWPQLRGHLPFGTILPMYGVYAEGFWDRSLTPMPGSYRAGFQFSLQHTESAIATDQLGQRIARDDADVAHYPFLTCEIGGGMMNSYHRRILIDPRDVWATTLVKLGSGSNLLGYYMYHGGTNPEGKLTTLNETQATGYWNDLPVKNYDFQAPLGQYGQIRPHYQLLRRLHLFLHQWGDRLAAMPAVMPEQRPTGAHDVTTLRWSVRSDGTRGFVFINNYERLADLPAKHDVQFNLTLPHGQQITFPDQGVTIPANACFFWPFHFDIGDGVTLDWATAQPICALNNGLTRTVFFAAIPGVPCRLSLDHKVRTVSPGRDVALTVAGQQHHQIQIVVLSDQDSLHLWKTGDHVFLSPANLVRDHGRITLTATDPAQLTLAVYPLSRGHQEGLFRQAPLPVVHAVSAAVTTETIQSAGPLRHIGLGPIKTPVAQMPSDQDFRQAAVWRIHLPHDLDLQLDPLLRIHYVGDVARAVLNGRLITDDFYNSRPLDIGLKRYAPDILNGDLRIEILPLQKDAPIYIAASAKPDFGNHASVVHLKHAELLMRYQVTYTY